MPTSWINNYPKETLIPIAASHGLDTSGTLDEIRARMRRFAREHPDQCIEPTVQSTRENRVPPALTVMDRSPNDEISLINMRAITPTTEAILPPPLVTAMTHERPESHAKILNQMRK